MARDFFINGETMVFVKGQAGTSIATLQQLGLADSPVRITLNSRYEDMNVDAWGLHVPVDVQSFLADAIITMQMIHFDPDILRVCFSESAGSATADGTMARAGVRLGNNKARFAQGNSYIGLNLSSPVAGLPWRFWYSYLVGPPFTWPQGTQRSPVTLNWRAIPYTQDPYGGGSAQPGTAAGTGSFGAVLYDHVLDN